MLQLLNHRYSYSNNICHSKQNIFLIGFSFNDLNLKLLSKLNLTPKDICIIIEPLLRLNQIVFLNEIHLKSLNLFLI